MHTRPRLRRGGGGGGGGGGGSTSTVWTKIETQGVCDNGNCGEGNEFEIHLASTGARLARWEGVPSTGAAYPNRVILAYPPGLPVNLTVKETDTWPSSDDNFEYVTYNPNYAGPIPLSAGYSGFGWPLKQSPHLSAFDPYTVGVYFTW